MVGMKNRSTQWDQIGQIEMVNSVITNPVLHMSNYTIVNNCYR